MTVIFWRIPFRHAFESRVILFKNKTYDRTKSAIYTGTCNRSNKLKCDQLRSQLLIRLLHEHVYICAFTHYTEKWESPQEA